MAASYRYANGLLSEVLKDPEEPTELDDQGETVAKPGLADLVAAMNENTRALLDTHTSAQRDLFGALAQSHDQLMQAISRPRRRTMQRADGTVLTAMDEPA